MGDGPIVDAWCPFQDSYLSLGDGPAGGVSMTTSGDVFTFSNGKTNVDANASLWLQSNAAGGIVCSSGVTIGSPAGVLASAGGNVDIFAGCAVSPSVGSPNGPGGEPTQADIPCGSTEENVNRANALNSGIKGVSDVAAGIQGLGSADGALETASAAWDVAKGSWDMVKAGEDAGAYQMNKRVKDGIDGGVGVIDTVMSAAGGNLPNLVGGLQAGDKLLNAIAGEQGADGAGGGGGGEGGGHGGGGMIEARAPAGIKKLTDKDMEAFVAGKIEYKAGTNIGLNATNKVETVSMMFEAHANIQAAMKGLARAKVESFGSVVVDGKAKFTVETKGVGKIETGAALTIESGALMKIESKAVLEVHATGALDAKSNASMKLEAPTVKIDSPTTTITGDVKIEKTLEIAQLVTAKANVSIEGQLDVEGAVVCNNTVACKDLCSFG